MKGPRRINIVTILIGLVVAAAIYFGWKFIPPYWQASKVDNLLDGYKQEASEINRFGFDPRQQEIIDKVKQDLIELGVDDPELDVRFGPDYASLQARYSVEIKFFFGKSKTLRFDRSVNIPRDDF